KTVTNTKVFDANMTIDGATVTGPITFNDKSEMGIHTIMTNLYYDFRDVVSETITPYVDLGFGLALLYASMETGTNIQYLDKTYSDSFDYGAAQLAWSVGAGVSFQVTEYVYIDVGYKYIDGGLTSLSNGLYDDFDLDADLKLHDFTVGVRYAY
ncbi:MAG: outer membrane beta-barrel protein, partial [Deltaproteobacteria bacterium]|nr:outer membrane beta-barrel protein [Deltaproteobacteria bacterium]